MANDNRNNNNRDDNWWSWKIGAGVAAAAATVGAGIYYMTSRSPVEQQRESIIVLPWQRSEERQGATSNIPTQNNSAPSPSQGSSTTSFLKSVVAAMTSSTPKIGISKTEVPTNPSLHNLNALLDDIYVRYVMLKTEDFAIYYRVFCVLFEQLQEKMKQVDRYYDKYSSRKQFAGSHFDRLRIKRPDEFDMDIVIGLPLNFDLGPNGDNDITLEHKSAGYVQLKTGTQFKNLPMRDGIDWQTNKTAFNWKDDRDYIARHKFIQWFKGVIDKALNEFETGLDGRPRIAVDGVLYSIRKTESGPAVTFIVENTNNGFQLDIDFVPALKFPERRWPFCRGYRSVPSHCHRDDFMVVPKPNKASQNMYDETRCWRIAMHDQEKKLLHDLQNMKPTLRLLKKIRDTLGMDKISSYYIKTIFFYEIVDQDASFWTQSRSTLLKIMVARLINHMERREILYFWNPDNNLIGDVSPNVLNEYCRKLKQLLVVLNDPNQYKTVAKYLLTAQEFNDYNVRFLHCD